MARDNRCRRDKGGDRRWSRYERPVDAVDLTECAGYRAHAGGRSARWVAYAGDLATFADDVVGRSLAMWDSEGVLDAVHAPPFGELPGTVGIGRSIEFSPELIPARSLLVDRVCADQVRASGLIARGVTSAR